MSLPVLMAILREEVGDAAAARILARARQAARETPKRELRVFIGSRRPLRAADLPADEPAADAAQRVGRHVATIYRHRR
jgi:hypothetical protein